MREEHYDWVIIGSGFGGSVSAHRLTQKGYKVLVLEKGRRFNDEDFPKNNWDLKRWMWNPMLGLKGIFQMSFMKHMTVLHGVGVGGGSLVYANTLPTPKSPFFEGGSWAGLRDWETELAPHYATAKRMLGATPNPLETKGDRVMKEIARDMGREEHCHPTEVAVYFGEPNKKVPDPYFEGEGPDRVGCTFCGACMTGCRIGAKNTLVKNYLYLAEKNGAEVRPETEVTAVRPNDGGGYRVETKPTFSKSGADAVTADRVILSGGVMGTMPLLLQMKEDPEGLPKLSDRVGDFVRSNSESLIAVVSPEEGHQLLEGRCHHVDSAHRRAQSHGAGALRCRVWLFSNLARAARAGANRALAHLGRDRGIHAAAGALVEGAFRERPGQAFAGPALHALARRHPAHEARA